MLRILLAMTLSSLMITGALSQDGARAYLLLPENTNIIGLICKIIMPLARRDVEIVKTRLNAFIVAQSTRAKPY